jgi:hypothetical protein
MHAYIVYIYVIPVHRWASGATSPNGIGKSSAGGIYVNSYYDSGNIEVRSAACLQDTPAHRRM